ncbi:putative holin [Citrobacter sp. ANG330]|uniref:putative holin n=1 Tax=Citrobacter sp. ANG330 TaxID=3048142 RepID=UPI0039C378DD
MFLFIEYVISTVSARLEIMGNQSDVLVLMGAACGAAIFILDMQQTSSFHRLCYFLISLFLGSSCAGSVTDFLNSEFEKFMTPAPTFNKVFTAALTAAVAVRLINKFSDYLLSKFSGNK